MIESLKKELNQHFSSNDNAIEKISMKKMKKKNTCSNYSPTKVRARNSLTNVSYNRVKEADFNNRWFVIDCYSFILLYLNPFYLERKFENVLDREFVNTIWNLQMSNDSYTFICQPEHYETLNKLKLKFQDVFEIVESFADDLVGCQQLREFLVKNARSFQFVYGNLFPRYFALIDDYSITSTLSFDNVYKIYLSQKSVSDWQQYSLSQTIKTEDTFSTQVNFDDNDIDFNKTSADTETKKSQTDGTAKETVKKQRKK